MSSSSKSILVYIIIIILLSIIAFLLGQKSVKIKPSTEIKYIPGKIIKDSVPKNNIIVLNSGKPYVDYNVIDKGLVKTIVTHDSVYKQLDTSKVVKDWSTPRNYKVNLFNIDTVGKCIVKGDVQYNKLYNVSYEFTPINKIINNTFEKKKLLEFYIGGSIFTNSAVAGQGGVFIKNHYGVGYQYQYDIINSKPIHGITLLYKF